MARPRGADPAQTRQRLREAATASFAAHGLDGTSLRDVARRAGVSLATIHYYFGSKGELYDACMRATTADLQRASLPFLERLDALQEAVRSGPRKEAALKSMVEQIIRDTFRFARERQEALRVLMRPVLDTGELDPYWREDILLPFIRSTAAALGDLMGLPEASLRLAMQSLIVLGVRYALSSARELVRLAHVSDEQQALKVIEDHLVETAMLLLWKGGPQ